MSVVSEFTIHGKEAVINKVKLKAILDSKGMEFKELHKRAESAYDLDITYKGFMSLLQNRNTWKLLYAWAIVDVLNIGFKEVFEIVNIDIEKKKIEKVRWKEKYQK